MDKWQVSIIIPVIRPAGAKKCIDALDKDPSFQDFEIVMEVDEDRIGCPRMVKRLVSRTKYDWIMFLGDDTVPHSGMVLNAFVASEKLPDQWGLVGLHDGWPGAEGWATHWMGHKDLLPLLGGEFFHTGYSHCFCDCELLRRCRDMGRYVFADSAKLTHNNPLMKGERLDSDYARVYDQVVHRQDLVLYRRRERNNWR